MIEVTNGKVYLTGDETDGNISTDNTTEGYAIYDAIDPATGDGSVAISFSNGTSVTKAEQFLRTGLVMKVKEPTGDHTLQVRIFGSTLESDTNALTMATFGLNFDAADFGLERAVDAEEETTADAIEKITENNTENTEIT